MKIKNGKWKVVLGAILFALIITFNITYAANSSDVVRVGITDNKFQNVLRQEVTIFGTAECDLCDKSTKKIITKVTPNTDINIKQSEQGLIITIGTQSRLFQDVVIICPQGLLGVRGLLRKGTQALYHGAFEIDQRTFRVSILLT